MCLACEDLSVNVRMHSGRWHFISIVIMSLYFLSDALYQSLSVLLCALVSCSPEVLSCGASSAMSFITSGLPWVINALDVSFEQFAVIFFVGCL